MPNLPILMNSIMQDDDVLEALAEFRESGRRSHCVGVEEPRDSGGVSVVELDQVQACLNIDDR